VSERGRIREQKRKLSVRAGRLFGVLEELGMGGLVTASRFCDRLTGGVKQQKDGSQEGRERSSLTLTAINFALALSTPARVTHAAKVYGWLFLEQANASASIMNGGPLAQ
jgi:hypothetical protein